MLQAEREGLMGSNSHAGSDNEGFESCGHPSWNKGAWDRFKARYGRDPFNREELPPDLEQAPAWVFQRLGLRPPLMTR